MADPTAETGFAVLPDVLSARELRQLSEALDVSHLPGSRAGARHLMSYAPVAALASDPRLLRIARRCIGPDVYS